MANPQCNALRRYLVVYTENHDDWVCESMSIREIRLACKEGRLYPEHILIIDGHIIKGLGNKNLP